MPIEELRARLEEAEETLRAIRSGEVDALVVAGPEGDQVYTLSGEERIYRFLVEAMNEGALILAPDGDIIYANRAFADIIGLDLSRVTGASIHDFVAEPDRAKLDSLLRNGMETTIRAEVLLRCPDGHCIPVLFSVALLQAGESEALSVVVSELTELRAREEELQAYRELLEQMVATRTAELEATNEELRATNQNLQAEIEERLRAEELLRESEARFGIAFRHTAVGLAIVDLERRVLRANVAFERIVGLPLAALSSRPYSDLIHPDHRDTESDLYNGLIRGAIDSYNEEMRLISADGEPVWCSITTSLVRGVWGQPLFTVVAVEDISKRRQIEEELRDSEERYRALVGASSQALYRMSPDWTEMRSLRGGGFLADTIEPNRNWVQEYIHPDDQEWVLGMVNNAIRTGSIFELEHRVLRADGSLGWTASRAVPVRDASGKIVEWFGAASDITDRKEIEIERENSRRALEEVYERERRIAETLQRNFLPDRPAQIEGYVIEEAYYPALDEAAIGGDVYDTFQLPSGKTGIVIADVSGKGLKAARHGALLKYMLRAYAYQNEDPAEVMRQLNDSANRVIDMEAFITCFFGVLDPADRTLRYANAGHDAPVYIPSADGYPLLLEQTGSALGMVPDLSYESRTLQLQPGDLLFFYTDGVTDARGAEERMETEGLTDLLAEKCRLGAKQIVGCVVDEVMRRSGKELADDVAILALEVRNG